MPNTLDVPLSQMSRQDLWCWVHQFPKIALHRHLEGSLRLSTLVEVAQQYGIQVPSYEPEKLRPYVQITDMDQPDFHLYLAKFNLLRNFYASREVIQRVTQEAVLDAAADNIRYLELRFNPVALSRARGFGMWEVVEWVVEAVEKAQTETDTRTCLILLINREEPLESANEIVDLAIAYHGTIVRAIDLAGDETRYPPELFVEPFRRAREAGVRITVHAGEAAGPDSVREAVCSLGAERIGHGIRSLEDSNVVQMVYEGNVTLEVCPTSNIQTGVVPWLAIHPLPDLMRLRLRTTINTDNVSISDTTLTDEYIVAIKGLGLTKRQIYEILSNALNAAFLPDAERPKLKAKFREWLAPYPDAAVVLDA
jgi:adenosine deaminase